MAVCDTALHPVAHALLLSAAAGVEVRVTTAADDATAEVLILAGAVAGEVASTPGAGETAAAMQNERHACELVLAEQWL